MTAVLHADPELAARVTAAKAVVADYGREDQAYRERGLVHPDYPVWADRLCHHLEMVLDRIEAMS